MNTLNMYKKKLGGRLQVVIEFLVIIISRESLFYESYPNSDDILTKNIGKRVDRDFLLVDFVWRHRFWLCLALIGITLSLLHRFLETLLSVLNWMCRLQPLVKHSPSQSWQVAQSVRAFEGIKVMRGASRPVVAHILPSPCPHLHIAHEKWDSPTFIRLRLVSFRKIGI